MGIDVYDLEHLNARVADHFAVVEPSGTWTLQFSTLRHSCESRLEQEPITDHVLGILFQDKNCASLNDLEAILDANEPIGITIDGHAIRDPPGPKGLPFFGTYYEVYPEHLGNHQRMFETYGPVIKTTDMGRTNYFTNDPAIAAIAMSESLFFSKIINENHPLRALKDNTAGLFIGDTDTEEWRLAHKFMASAFSAKAVRHYTPLVQREAESSYPVFDELDKRGEAWNVYSYMLKLVSSAIGKLILNQQFKSFDDVDAPQPRIVQALDELVATNNKVRTKGQWYSHLPFGEPKKLRELNIEIKKMIEDAIESCEGLGVENLPMSDAALQASSIVDYALRAADSQGNKCPREIVIRTMLVLLVAGFFTTSTLLSWLINGLVAYPGMQDRLLQELVDHGINAETKWTYDNTNALLFLDNYIKETQRMHNPVVSPARTAKVDMILPGGYKIPAGATVICVSAHEFQASSRTDM